MATITPNTAVYLASVPLVYNDKNQILFETKQAQLQYFMSKSIYTFDDFTFQRKDNIIRISENADLLMQQNINYCFYQNSYYGINKYFYAYITKIEFINMNCSHIHIKTDVFQSWFLDCEIKSAFIKRETVKNDDLFKHTLPENLPTGEQITTSTTVIGDSLKAQAASEFDENYYCVIMTSEPVKWLSVTIPSVDSFVGGVANPCYMYATNLADFYGFMDKITENGQVNAVVCCVAIPKFFVNFHELETGGGGGGGETGVNYLGSPYSASFNITQTYSPPNHYGIDMVGLSDKNIYTPVAGTVVDSRWENDNEHSQGYGQLVRILNHATGLYFIFGHLSERSVSEGDTVTAGQKIGVEGSTGYSTGSHLHYQVSSDWNSGTVNPANYGTFQNIEGVQ